MFLVLYIHLKVVLQVYAIKIKNISTHFIAIHYPNTLIFQNMVLNIGNMNYIIRFPK